MLNVTTSAAFAFLSGALLAAEHANAFPPLPKPPAVPLPGTAVRAESEAEKQLKKDLEDANKKIDKLSKQVERLTELLNGRYDDKGVRYESDAGAIEDIKKLRNKIADLDAEIKSLKAQSQTALKPVVPNEARKGTVRVVNEYPVEISILVNEKSYRVAASTKLDVEVPAGEFTYQLLPTAATATRSPIKDKETVTLRIK